MFWTYAVACCLLGLVTMLGPSAAGQPMVGSLLEALKLSEYPAGTKPPQLSSVTAAGQKVSLASLKGKVVLLNFWASWCLECRPEMPVFEQLHREFAAQGLAVLGVNVRENGMAVRNYAKELKLTFPLIMDVRGELQASYGVVGLPTTFLIGRDGRTVALAVGPREWGSVQAREIIEVLLAEPASEKGRP